MRAKSTCALLSLCCMLILFELPAKAQFKNMKITAGIQTSGILGDNPATWPILERDTNIKHDVGGGFGGNQLGFSLRANFGFDTTESSSPIETSNLGKFLKYISSRVVIPFGIDYTIYQAKERVPIELQTTLYMRHTVQVPTFVLGLNYYLFKFPIANVKAYTGIEARAAFLLQGDFYRRISYPDHDDIIDTKAKDATFRLGGAFRFGVEGEIKGPWYVNISCAFSALNILGRDDARGELLTPISPPKTYEPQETMVYQVHYAIMLQYKL